MPVNLTIKCYNKTARSYFESRKKHQLVWQRDFFLKHFSGTKLLDVGCGPGIDANFFEGKGISVTGIDLAQNFISMAKEYSPKSTFLLMDQCKLDFADASFDGVWSCGSFHHVKKSESLNVLRELLRVLKSGAAMYICVQSGKGEKIVQKDYYGGNHKFFAYYSEQEFCQMLRACGFDILYCKVEDTKNHVWINVFAKRSF